MKIAIYEQREEGYYYNGELIDPKTDQNMEILLDLQWALLVQGETNEETNCWKAAFDLDQKAGTPNFSSPNSPF